MIPKPEQGQTQTALARLSAQLAEVNGVINALNIAQQFHQGEYTQDQRLNAVERVASGAITALNTAAMAIAEAEERILGLEQRTVALEPTPEPEDPHPEDPLDDRANGPSLNGR